MNRFAVIAILAGTSLLSSGCIAVGLGNGSHSSSTSRRLSDLEQRVQNLEERPSGMPFPSMPPPMPPGPMNMPGSMPPPPGSDPFRGRDEDGMRRRIEELERENRELREKAGNGQS